MRIIERGHIGQTYLIGADGEKSNLDVLQIILESMGEPNDAFDFVTDRPGHDMRYAIDSTKLRTSLDWAPRYTNFEEGIAATIDWYTANRTWWENDKKSVEDFYRAQGQ